MKKIKIKRGEVYSKKHKNDMEIGKKTKKVDTRKRLSKEAKW